MSTDVEYMAKELNALVGYKIVGTVMTEDKDSFGLILEKFQEPQQIAWIDCDAEGNGPGWVSIQENTDAKVASG